MNLAKAIARIEATTSKKVSAIEYEDGSGLSFNYSLVGQTEKFNIKFEHPYDVAIRDLMHNDSKGDWRSILDECHGDKNLATKVLIDALQGCEPCQLYTEVINSLMN